MSIGFSKSGYCSYLTCPKQLWLRLNMPQEEQVTEDAKNRMKQGTEVGVLARGYFGKYALAEVIAGGRQDHAAMIRRTRLLMAAGEEVICEAAFSCDSLYCAVDILRKEGGGWTIYEVKSSAEVKDIYLDDVAYQRYVLKKCGVNVTGVKLLHLNGSYVRHGDLDIKQLFKEEDVFVKSQTNLRQVANNIMAANIYLMSKAEPVTVFCSNCAGCGFCAHCRRDIPELSVFNLRGITKKYDYVNSGIVTFGDFAASRKDLSEGLKIQLEYSAPEKGTYIDKHAVRSFLNGLTYPLYFLDFETFQSALPPFDGSSPWQQIPSQYSLHWVEKPDGQLFHTEFLGSGVGDPRRALAEQLCRDIPKDVCVTAYSKKFECGILTKLAELFSDLSGHLLNVREHIVDLAVPFEKFYYYNSAMQGRYSIKYVLPAVYPADPALSYSGLAVKNGTEAMLLYPKLKDMPSEEQKKARQDLLKYCELDTFAMVKLWQALVRAG